MCGAATRTTGVVGGVIDGSRSESERTLESESRPTAAAVMRAAWVDDAALTHQ
jgi:hypothetical protein